MSEVLVLGASGAIGRFLLPRLLAQGHSVHAVSRQHRPADTAGVAWHLLDLAGPQGSAAVVPELRPIAAVVSAGPLDLAARWLPQSGLAPQRLVAFGSTSASSKQASADPAERDLAGRLLQAELALGAWASVHGCALTVLRPTLVYGAALDSSLSRIAALARKLGWVAIPRRALGLRQPVHAEDLAATAAAALALPATPRACYELPGGETLAYRDMVRRVLAVLAPRPRLLELPMPMLRAALAVAHTAGRLEDVGTATLLRTREDLAFDGAPAARDLGHAPRMFTPTANMLRVGPALPQRAQPRL